MKKPIIAPFSEGGGQLNSVIRSTKGFTLAEVLITLGIIGVVAAMTLPTLITNYQEKQIVTQLQKDYSMLSQAWQMLQNEYGEISTWGLENTNTGNVDPETGEKIYNHSAQSLIAQRLKQYLKVSRTCKLGEICYPNQSLYLNGNIYETAKPNSETSDSPAEANFFLNDGTYMTIGWYSNKTVDIRVIFPNTKKPVMGKHIFYFVAGDRGVLPEGDPKKVSPGKDSFTLQCNTTAVSLPGRGCAAWVIYNKNLDYLHCREKLGWDKASSCKE